MKQEKTYERHEGPTPNGGAYSVSVFYDENGKQTTKDKAKIISYIEYDENDFEIRISTIIVDEKEQK